MPQGKKCSIFMLSKRVARASSCCASALTQSRSNDTLSSTLAVCRGTALVCERQAEITSARVITLGSKP